MADEYTIDAKYKRDNLVAEHERYRRALVEIRDRCGRVAEARAVARRVLAK